MHLKNPIFWSNQCKGIPLVTQNKRYLEYYFEKVNEQTTSVFGCPEEND